jgi:hypothetical protein
MEKIMKLNKFVFAVLAFSALLTSQAYARDSFNVGINVNAYDYVAPLATHYPNTVYYGRTPTVIYYSAPTVQYVPIVSYRNDGRYERREADRCREPERNYYREWNHGWGNSFEGERHHGRGHWDRD